MKKVPYVQGSDTTGDAKGNIADLIDFTFKKEKRVSYKRFNCKRNPAFASIMALP